MATLKITKSSATSSLIILKVEGAVASDGIGVLEKECKGWLIKKKTVQLDFSGVTYIDHQGVRMLRSLWPAQLQIIHCPDFILQLLNLSEQG